MYFQVRNSPFGPDAIHVLKDGRKIASFPNLAYGMAFLAYHYKLNKAQLFEVHEDFMKDFMDTYDKERENACELA